MHKTDLDDMLRRVMSGELQINPQLEDILRVVLFVWPLSVCGGKK